MKQNKFTELEQSLKQAQERFDALVVERARYLYPEYDSFCWDDDQGSAMTKKECNKHAIESLREFENVKDALEDQKARRTVLRTVYMPENLDEKLRVLAFRQQREKQALIVEACTIYFEALNSIKTQ